METIKKSRISELEALRGIAAISVMYFHYTFQFRENFNYSFPKYLDFEYGHHGVELFFMISGFVIFMSLKNIKSTKEFFYKRFVRLYPTYWICLVITLIFIYVFNNPFFNFSTTEKLANFLMFQQLINIRNVDGSYWSLLPELCFYVTIILLWKFKLLKFIFIVSIVWLILMYVALLKPSIIDIILNLKFGMFFLIGMMFYKLKENIKLKMPHFIILICLITVYIVRGNLDTILFTIGFTILFYLLL